jgi:hypothetical protein
MSGVLESLVIWTPHPGESDLNTHIFSDEVFEGSMMILSGIQQEIWTLLRMRKKVMAIG